MNNSELTSRDRLFNTPLEIGLRCLIILVEARQACDLQRLKIYDYFLLHSSDVEGGPNSLHPPSPFRSGELLVKHSLIDQGIRLLAAKGLIEWHFSIDGIQYQTTPLAKPFLDYFESGYAVRARKVARWVRETFGDMDNGSLQGFVNLHVGKWGTEFTAEPFDEEEIV